MSRVRVTSVALDVHKDAEGYKQQLAHLVVGLLATHHIFPLVELIYVFSPRTSPPN